ncbi:MAG TPA: hypothetical protein VGC96_12305 [Candidatus Elarobacter sp.]|jgi:hypothetical protein
MVAAPHTPRRDSVAIAGSIAVHLCVLTVALAMLPRTSFPVDDPDERTLLTRILQIERRPAPKIVPQKHAALPVARTTVRERPLIHTVTTVEHAERRLVVATEHRAPATIREPDAPNKPEPARFAQKPAAAVPLPASAAATVSATGAPNASPAPSPVAAQREEGIGNFGETYPAAIEPSARNALVGGISGVVVRIAVDENGHATSIDFLRPPPDASAREELRSRLLAARFIPAACNGLRCAGTVELRT